MPPKKAAKKAADKSTLYFFLTLFDRSRRRASSRSESYKISRGLKNWNSSSCASLKYVSVANADCVRRVKSDTFGDLSCKWISKLCVFTHKFKPLKNVWRFSSLAFNDSILTKTCFTAHSKSDLNGWRQTSWRKGNLRWFRYDCGTIRNSKASCCIKPGLVIGWRPPETEISKIWNGSCCWCDKNDAWYAWNSWRVEEEKTWKSYEIWHSNQRNSWY